MNSCDSFCLINAERPGHASLLFPIIPKKALRWYANIFPKVQISGSIRKFLASLKISSSLGIPNQTHMDVMWVELSNLLGTKLRLTTTFQWASFFFKSSTLAWWPMQQKLPDKHISCCFWSLLARSRSWLQHHTSFKPTLVQKVVARACNSKHSHHPAWRCRQDDASPLPPRVGNISLAANQIKAMQEWNNWQTVTDWQTVGSGSVGFIRVAKVEYKFLVVLLWPERSTFSRKTILQKVLKAGYSTGLPLPLRILKAAEVLANGLESQAWAPMDHPARWNAPRSPRPPPQDHVLLWNTLPNLLNRGVWGTLFWPMAISNTCSTNPLLFSSAWGRLSPLRNFLLGTCHRSKLYYVHCERSYI